MKKFRYILELYLVKFLFWVFSNMPYVMASKMGSIILRGVGPYTKAHKTAKRNLEERMSNLSKGEINNILEGVWDNFGRFAAEFPIIFDLPDSNYDRIVEVKGKKNLDILKKHGGFLFSGHIANWEVIPRILERLNIPMAFVYRTANNKAVDKIINEYRKKSKNVILVPKGKEGARMILESIKEKRVILMLADQRMNDGISAPFLGKEAMTASAIANLALKHDLPIVPTRSIRINRSFKFKIEFLPAIRYMKTGNKQKDILNMIKIINKQIETWVKEYPEQWFWLHNRWKK